MHAFEIYDTHGQEIPGNEFVSGILRTRSTRKPDGATVRED